MCDKKTFFVNLIKFNKSLSNFAELEYIFISHPNGNFILFFI